MTDSYLSKAEEDHKAGQFSWIPFFDEMLSIICQRYDKESLCNVFHQLFEGVGGTQDKFSDGSSGPLREIDPLTFISYFNRGNTIEKRIEYCSQAKDLLNMKADVPSDLLGTPTLQNLNTWFFGWAKNRGNAIDNLWSFARKLENNSIDDTLFRSVLNIKMVGLGKLTTIMFLCKPNTYISFDSTNIPYFKSQGFNDLIKKVKDAPDAYSQYQRILRDIKERFENKPNYIISHAAFLFRTDNEPTGPDQPEDGNQKYWIIAPERQARLWSEWQEKEIISIGWDKLNDFNVYKSKEEIIEKLGEDKKQSAFMIWAFTHTMQVGDIIFVKKGTKKIIAYGEVLSDYIYAPERQEHKHIRDVKWIKTGEWDLPKDTKAHTKTLTEISKYPDYLERLKNIVHFNDEPVIPSSQNYWWLNANPNIWNFSDIKIGEMQTYTTKNEKGNKRRIYKHLTAVRPGDLVLGYVSSPDKEIIAICRITKGIHQSDKGEAIEFEKIEDITIPISYNELKEISDLSLCEPLKNNQGSLFKITENEYEIIRDLIDERNAIDSIAPIRPYSIEDALQDLFFTAEEFNEMLDTLKYKKNVILQGAPGVGKTFISYRLAYALMQKEAPQRVQMIQFHQSYSYEDFIQGYRPNDKQNFVLKNGIFYEFCKKAQRDTNNKYVFIIDEINRGNLSKIFGELMMLIEADKRGKEYAIPLTYALAAEEKFYIPDNLYLIGTMNTADRSLAMVDYALRRRFSFINLTPKFDTPEFKKYLKSKGLENDLIENIISKMNSLNTKISEDDKNLGIGYQIGHSFFCPNGHQSKYDENWYHNVVKYEIRPLLEEYWFDNIERVNQCEKELWIK